MPVAHPFSSAFPDSRWLGVSTDFEATVARIAAFSERNAATWRRLVAALPQHAQAIFALLGSPMTMRALASFAAIACAQSENSVIDLNSHPSLPATNGYEA